MEMLLNKIQKKYYWLVAFAFGAIAMFVMLSYSQLLTSGKYVILGGDAWEIYIANIRMLIRNLMHGETVWYSFTTSMGYNTALTVAFELMSPFNILFVLFAWADPNVILAIIIIAKVGTAAAAFQLFASKVLKNEGIASIVFSVFYAMCAFTVEYCIANFMWLDGLYMLPVVAWATYVAVKKNKYLFLTISYAYIFIVQFYMGYLLAGFSLILFFLLLFTQKKEERSAGIGASIGRYVLTVVLSVAVSAFLWMPVLSFLLHHTVSDATQFTSPGITPFMILNNLFWGEFQDYHTYPYIYCGLPGLILLPFYFTNKKIDAKERTVFGVLLTFFVLGCMLLPLYALLHAFDAPDMWNYRFSFIISFLLCAIAVRQSAYLSEMKGKWLAVFGTGLIIVYGMEQILQPLTIGWVARNSNKGLLINCAFVLFWILLVVLDSRGKMKNSTFAVCVLLLAVTEVVTNGCVRTFDPNWQQGLTKEENYYSWEKEAKRNLAEIDRHNEGMNPEEFYRICLYGDSIHNSDAYFGYNGVTDFNSAENEALRDFMQNMGFYTSTRRTGGTGLTPPMEMLLSVKNHARLYVDMAVLGVETDLKVYDNDYFLPLGYMVNNDILENVSYSSNVFENQNSLIRRVSGVDGVYEPVPAGNLEMTQNGDITFFVSDTPDKVFVQTKPVEEIFPDGMTQEELTAFASLEWGTFMNQANGLDSKYAVPFAAETIGEGNNHMIVLEAAGSAGNLVSEDDLLVYSLNEDRLKEAYESLSENVLNVEEYKSGYIKGRVKTSDTRNVLFTSIPYTDGWSVTLNGYNWEITPVCNGAFCAVILPGEGEYEIEMKYTCPGAAIGLWITIAGIALFVATTLSQRPVKAKSTKSET